MDKVGDMVFTACDAMLMIVDRDVKLSIILQKYGNLRATMNIIDVKFIDFVKKYAPDYNKMIMNWIADTQIAYNTEFPIISQMYMRLNEYYKRSEFVSSGATIYSSQFLDDTATQLFIYNMESEAKAESGDDLHTLDVEISKIRDLPKSVDVIKVLSNLSKHIAFFDERYITKLRENTSLSSFMQVIKASSINLFEPIITIDLKYLELVAISEGRSISANIISFMSEIHTYARTIYNIITTPNIDIKSFATTLVGRMSELKSKFPRCEEAFKCLHSSIDLICDNFPNHYRSYAVHGNNTLFMKDIFEGIVAANKHSNRKTYIQLRLLIKQLIGEMQKQTSIKPIPKKISDLIKTIDTTFCDNGANNLDPNDPDNADLQQYIREHGPDADAAANANANANGDEDASEEFEEIDEADIDAANVFANSSIPRSKHDTDESYMQLCQMLSEIDKEELEELSKKRNKELKAVVAASAAAHDVAVSSVEISDDINELAKKILEPELESENDSAEDAEDAEDAECVEDAAQYSGGNKSGIFGFTAKQMNSIFGII
jgi:hypothetical protein